MARKIKADLLVNVQGDLPFIHAATISRAVRPLRRNRRYPMGTVCTAIYDEAEWRDPNIVKVLTDRARFAMYFTRAPIPFCATALSIRNGRKLPGGTSAGFGAFVISGFMSIGADFLLKFARLRPTALEQIEVWNSCARWNMAIGFMSRRSTSSSVEVDTSADLKRAERYLKRRSN